MDYSRLSKESLIHEIEQLNQTLDYLKMDIKGLKHGVHNILDSVDAQTCWIASDYSVYWHNNYHKIKNENIQEGKCYHLFFGRSDVCEGCQLENSLRNKGNHLFTHNSGVSIHQMAATKFGMPGIIEFHMESKESKEEISKEKKLLKHYKKENEIVHNQNNQLIQYMEMFSKSLRTPLRALNGYFLLASESSDDSYVQAMKSSSEQLFETLNKFMIFTRHESGKMFFKKEEFKLLSVISDATAQARMYERSGSIHLVCAPTLPEVVKGDALNFKLLLNYLYETILYLCGSHPIEVTISEISQTQEELNLKITMTGKKVTERELADIKKRIDEGSDFTELDTYSVSMGLQLSERIVETHEGTIEVGTGADGEAYVDVIIKLGKLHPMESVKEKHPVKKGNRILIADVDRPEISYDVLSNFEIFFAHTGDEALKLYFEKQPDLVLINVAIETCDGFEVFDEIERRRQVHRPIVAMSKKLIDNERVFMQDYGFDDYIPKPLTEEGFHQIVAKFL